MKLELKHVIKAFEHGQKVKYFDDERCEWKICEIVELRIDECTISEGLIDYEVDFTEIKPILRPLSDLTEEIEVNGEKFVPKDKLFYSDNRWIQFKKSINKNAIHCESYYIIEKLFEWHFDVFGLIESGLAIDINTIKI